MVVGNGYAVAAPPHDACAYLSDQVAHQSAGAVLLASYPNAARGPLNNTAFTYDNAVANFADDADVLHRGCSFRARDLILNFS